MTPEEIVVKWTTNPGRLRRTEWVEELSRDIQTAIDAKLEEAAACLDKCGRDYTSINIGIASGYSVASKIVRSMKSNGGKTEAATDDEPSGGCPCLYIEPCHPKCTCRNGFYSHGCDRCCSYGSLEQQTAKAQHIAAALDAFQVEQQAQ